jgi:aspartate/methionine/tyrosine aminotransferase
MREVIKNLEASRIREVANAGLGRDDVLKFWFGESDEVTPALIREEAVRSLQAGDTFYSHNLGLPELRQALGRYTHGLHPGQSAQAWADRTVVTSGGVNGLMLACQALVNAGDEVVVVTPIWPNLVAQPAIMGARVQCVPLVPDAVTGQWQLDMAALRAAVTPATRMLVLNAPNNPTGWTLTAEEQRAILSHCRSTGTWLLADEVYERLYFAPSANSCAPSFLDCAEPDDRLVVAHSFSKSFLMTGWRLGWLVLPPVLVEAVGKLVEFNTSCAPVFVQRAACAALAHGEAITPELVNHLKNCRDLLTTELSRLPGVACSVPLGGMYAFFRIDGQPDSLATAKRLVLEVGLGLAPGSAFGAEAEGWLRWCFATRDLDRLHQGVGRLSKWLRL